MTTRFIEGARAVGHEVSEIYTSQLDFGGELLSVDMELNDRDYVAEKVLSMEGAVGDYYRAVHEADVLVLASPVYWWNIAGNLKNAIDYLQPLQQGLGWQNFRKETALLLVAGGNECHNPSNWYREFERFGFPNHGIVAGYDKLAEAYQLGQNI